MISSSLLSRVRSTSLRSAPLATMLIAALTVLGCGGGSSGGGTGGEGGAAGTPTGGTSAKGGSGGGTAGKSGTGGSGTGGGGGSSVTETGGNGGTSTTGTGGATTGTGGAAGSGTTGTGGATTGTGGATTGTGGATTGTGGATTGTGGAAGSTSAGSGGASAGAGGTSVSCTNGTACATSGGVQGVCMTGVCQGCASDGACSATTAYGAGYICILSSGNCVQGTCHTNGDCSSKICNSSHTCVACATAGDCTTAYGSGYICQTSTGTCVQGNCNTNGDCGAGQICSGTTCTSCGTSDSACTTAYGSGYICVSGNCVTGNCHTGAQCTGGQSCSVSTNTCGSCTGDNDCQISYGSGYICGTSNTCVQGNCHNASTCSGELCTNYVCTPCSLDTQCASGQLCLSGACVTGNCRDQSNCTGGQICTANSCSACGNDSDCTTQYGPNNLCQSGSCVTGDCRAAGGCAASSQICNTGTLECGACTTDAQCVSEYSAGMICIAGACTAGTCHNSTTCAGQICSASTHTCGTCGSDSQCASDPAYGSNHLCQGGDCISGQCRTAQDCNNVAQICTSSFTCTGCSVTSDCTTAYGANHVCSAGACISGNCNTSADCGGNQLCVAHACVACTTDTQCTADTTYGSQHICSVGQCLPGDCHTSNDCLSTGQLCNAGTRFCVACGSDTSCQSDNAYGASDICLGSVCVVGNCHDTSADCTGGQICGISAQHTCGACGADGQCTTDGNYGPNDICYQGSCLTGNCHAKSSDCTGANLGLICGVVTPETCGSCISDAQCKSDTFYGPGTICDVSTGKCTTAACSTNDVTCGANSADFCCGSLCVTGNCCNNTDCLNNPSFGTGYACTNNNCSHCDAISGNVYYVDPVNGNDSSATGSGLSSGAAVAACSFKTLSHALTVISSLGAGAGTKVVIMGSAGSTTHLSAGDTLPLTVPTNVTITNSGGPVTIVLPNATSQTNPTNVSGFVLSNNNSGISGSTSTSAPLVLDGNGNLSGIAVSATGTGTVSLSNLTIQNTRAHGITVTNGTMNIGQAVVVKGAGSAAAPINRDALDITGGIVNITVASGQTPSQFTNNTQRGIEVTGNGSVNITGTASTTPVNGNGTVVASGNTDAGLYINQTPGGTGALCSINGLVSWNNNTYGAHLFGGTQVTIRNSVFGISGNDGILISNAGAGGTAAQRLDISKIDIGNASVGGAGNNWLQFPTTVVGRNTNAGICVSIGANTAGGSLLAAGNEWTTGAYTTPNTQTQVNCATTAMTITKATNFTTNTGNSCTGGAAVGHAANSVVTTYVFNNCN